MRLLLSLLLSLSLAGVCEAAASRDFTGSDNSRVDFGDVTVFDGATAFTAAFWLKLDSTSGGPRIITKWGDSVSADQAFIVQMDATNEMFLGIRDNATDACFKETSVTNLATDIWYHIATVWTAGACNIVIYVNGVSQALSTIAGATTDQIQDDTGTSFQIGHETDEGSDGAEGKYVHLGLWTAALSASEVLSLANGTPPYFIKRENLVMCPQVLGDATEKDLCSTSSGTVTGATASADGPPIFLTTPLATLRTYWNAFLAWAIPNVYADDIITCNPADPTVPNRVASYTRNDDPYKSGAITNPNAFIYSDPPVGTDQAWDGTVPSVSQRYWKCAFQTLPTGTFFTGVVEMKQAEKDALTAADTAAAESALRSGSKTQFDGQNTSALGLRCFAKVLLDEINTLRTRTNAVKNCVANAATLNAAKTCEAALTDFSDRTLAQAKTAIGTCVDTGAADE